METKTCTKCKRSLPKDNVHFRKHRRCKDGLYTRCKECEGKRFTNSKAPKLMPKSLETGRKICSKCKIEKPLDYFSKEKRNRDGKRSECKECYKVIRDKWVNKNTDYVEKWHRKNPNYRKETYLKRIHVEKEYSRTWQQNNKEKCRTRSAKRRQLKKELPYNYNETDWKETLIFFSNKCCYCGCESELQQEHFIPMNKGGAFIKANIIPACASCNSSKCDRDFEVWYSKQPFYNKGRERKILDFVGVKNKIQQLSIL